MEAARIARGSAVCYADRYYLSDLERHDRKEYKQFKGLKKENLRDNMTNKELVLNMLAELSTKEISESKNPETFREHMDVAEAGGEIARNARMELEAKTGKAVISPLNAKTGIALNSSPEEEDTKE